MKYWEPQEDGTEKAVSKPITKDSVLSELSFIADGYLPDWNHKRQGEKNLPDEYYPLHVAMNIAIQAINAMGDDFFAAIDRKEDEKDAKLAASLELIEARMHQ